MFALAKTAGKPEQLGVVDGRLAPCPGSPNCVSTQAADDRFRMDPIPFQGSGAKALAAVKSLLDQTPRCRVTEAGDGYLHAEFTSRVFGFVDDVEFLVDEPDHQIHFRSASRVGYHDLGANRRRMERISQKLAGRLER